MVERVVVVGQVDEAGPGRMRFPHRCKTRKPRGEDLSEPCSRQPGRFRSMQGGIGGKIAPMHGPPMHNPGRKQSDPVRDSIRQLLPACILHAVQQHGLGQDGGHAGLSGDRRIRQPAMLLDSETVGHAGDIIGHDAVGAEPVGGFGLVAPAIRQQSDVARQQGEQG